ncbi:MAG: hypothetical protein QXT99_10225 [Candidatus Nitrosotenuis sp.]
MTRKNILHFRHYLILIVSITVFLIGCATTPPKEVDLKESLMTRAQQYWDMRMKDGYEESYKMEDRDGLPAYNEYMNKAMMIKKFSIKAHSVKNVIVEGDKGIVDVEFSFIMPPVTKPFVQVIKDNWLYKDGEWRHLFR